ncbi:MAG: lamin tail domain-containing protein [Myxococcales bacterium]|nr:lamin tail domain-containing protein [Myxococcales bacterium]
MLRRSAQLTITRTIGLALLVLLVLLASACAGGKTIAPPNDGIGPQPDRSIDSILPRDGFPDVTRDGPLGDQPPLADITVDSNADTLSPDTTFDTFSPDSSVDSTADVGPGGEICSGGVDDDSDGYIDCADPDCYNRTPCVAAGRTLVVQEVFPGQPDYIVLRNAGTTVRNISGYTLEFRGTGTVNYTLPSRTLAPGQTVHVFESGAGLATDIEATVNIPFYDALAGFSNAVILRNPTGTVIDYAGFGDSLVGLPTGITQTGGPVSYTGFNASTDSHFRSAIQGNTPTFRASDWKRATSTR